MGLGASRAHAHAPRAPPPRSAQRARARARRRRARARDGHAAPLGRRSRGEVRRDHRVARARQADRSRARRQRRRSATASARCSARTTARRSIASIHPGAIDIPDDGIDQNCDGHDFSLRDRRGADRPERCRCPTQFKKPTGTSCSSRSTRVRYDHTTFGGYADGPKHRDTTPRLAELVEAARRRSRSATRRRPARWRRSPRSSRRSTSTTASRSTRTCRRACRRGSSPRTRLLPEIMKRGGYHTGVIASHEYWNDWGMDQGVDDYDNSIGKTPDPYPRRRRQGHRSRARVDLAPAGQEVVPVGALHRSARPLRRAPRRRRLRLEPSPTSTTPRSSGPISRSAACSTSCQRLPSYDQHDHHHHERSRRLDGRAHRAARHARHRAVPRAAARADDLLRPRQRSRT